MMGQDLTGHWSCNTNGCLFQDKYVRKIVRGWGVVEIKLAAGQEWLLISDGR